jgi:hypothetical protein
MPPLPQLREPTSYRGHQSTVCHPCGMRTEGLATPLPLLKSPFPAWKSALPVPTGRARGVGERREARGRCAAAGWSRGPTGRGLALPACACSRGPSGRQRETLFGPCLDVAAPPDRACGQTLDRLREVRSPRVASRRALRDAEQLGNLVQPEEPCAHRPDASTSGRRQADNALDRYPWRGTCLWSCHLRRK